ncbi:hypothetical protein C2S52_005267 [Perilla frutescens var. hirtella]|nr:hypothetical protein C2S51_010384 [Perilla frutescens var. frutescens]KAH6794790.1 hypothetical protein C2S52_005267 [Perilla frutescens var. hirtella]
MAKLLQTLIPLALLLAVAPTTARSQTTSFTYDFYGSQPTDLTYQGDAHFPSETTFLRLANPQTASIGRVLYSTPIQFWEEGAQVDFETTINFIITPNGDATPADGLTFFIAPVGSTIPASSSGGNFGIFGSSGTSPSVFAVEFDTYTNGAWDPDYRHVGIDIGSRASSNTTEVDGAIIGQQVTARIDYEEATKVISVAVAAGSKTYEVSYVYDLSTLVDQQVQVGLSAATGDYVATHDVVSWYFTSTLVHTAANAAANIRQYV